MISETEAPVDHGATPAEPEITEEQAREALKVIRQRMVQRVQAAGRPVDTDELEGHIVLFVVQRLDGFDDSRASLRTFVSRCADSGFVDFWRRRNAPQRGGCTTSSLDDEFEEACADPEQRRRRELDEARLDFEELASQLEHSQRQLCDLLKRLSVAETAKALGVHRGTVYRRIKAMRRRFEHASLREYLEE